MNSYKHYIRIENDIVIHGFSDAFEQPQAGDLALSGEFGRHFQLNIRNDRGQFRYKLVEGQMTERGQAELDTEWNARPPAPPSPLEAQILTVDERTVGMQEIDQFTLETLTVADERTLGMQEIDQFTLDLVFDMQTKIDELQAEITALKGGA